VSSGKSLRAACISQQTTVSKLCYADKFSGGEISKQLEGRLKQMHVMHVMHIMSSHTCGCPSANEIASLSFVLSMGISAFYSNRRLHSKTL